MSIYGELTVPSERELEVVRSKYGPLLVITPRQYGEGYREGSVDGLKFQVVGKTTDGNLIVVDPRNNK